MDAPDFGRAGRQLVVLMEYADFIAKEVASLPTERQAQVLDFIKFLKLKRNATDELSVPRTSNEIEAFFRSFNVDTSNFKFDRDDATTR
jgi:hypothetical protein